MTDFVQNSCLHWSQEKNLFTLWQFFNKNDRFLAEFVLALESGKKKNFLHFGLVLKTRGQCYDHYFCRFWQFFNKNAVPFKSIHTYMLWIFLC
jgi:hypothetical protein